MKKRITNDGEFKQMVVELAKTREDDISGLEAEPDLRAELINRWKRKALANLGASFPGHSNKSMTEEQKEIARLKKELGDAQIERDILKKAVSIPACRQIATDSRHKYPIVENKLNRNFNVTRPSQVWVSDKTYIRTYQG